MDLPGVYMTANCDFVKKEKVLLQQNTQFKKMQTRKKAEQGHCGWTGNRKRPKCKTWYAVCKQRK